MAGWVALGGGTLPVGGSGWQHPTAGAGLPVWATLPAAHMPALPVALH